MMKQAQIRLLWEVPNHKMAEKRRSSKALINQKKKTVTIEITFNLEDPQGGDGHFIITPDTGIPKPRPLGTLIKWSKEQQECLEPSIVKKPRGHWDMPEVSRAISIIRGLLATTIHQGEIQIPQPADLEGWVRVLEYWTQLVRRKIK